MKSKEFVCLLACAVFFWATIKFSMFWAVFIVMVFLYIGIYLANVFDFYTDLKWHADLKKDIHEGHTSPNDKQVYQRMQHHRKMLLLSGNPLYNFKSNETIKDGKPVRLKVWVLMKQYKEMDQIDDDPAGSKIHVYATMFRDHLNPTEFWDDYLVRRKEEEEVKIKKQAIKQFQEEGQKWSWKFHQNQHGIYMK